MVSVHVYIHIAGHDQIAIYLLFCDYVLERLDVRQFEFCQFYSCIETMALNEQRYGAVDVWSEMAAWGVKLVTGKVIGLEILTIPACRSGADGSCFEDGNRGPLGAVSRRRDEVVCETDAGVSSTDNHDIRFFGQLWC